LESHLQQAITEQIRALGVQAGSVVMVHTSMRKVGPVEGGAQGLLDALRAALTNEGTLLMVLSADTDQPFDARHSKVDTEDMGVFAEVFRTFPGVRVNDHAANRSAALGTDAAYFLEPTPLYDYHGPGSVLERFTKRDGLVLRLGAHVDRVTLTHYAEYLAEVPNKRRVRRRYVRADIGEQWIDYCAAGRARTGPVGNCTAELFGAQDFVLFAVRWMEQNLGTPIASATDEPVCTSGSALRGQLNRQSNHRRCASCSGSLTRLTVLGGTCDR
jgi:aminoglycoside N3'-acetyltransferase